MVRGLLIMALWLALAIPAQAGVNASVTPNPALQGELVTLSLRASGEIDGEPDLAPLAAQFEVVGQSSSNQVSYNNGLVSHQRQWQIRLRPKALGTLRIPPITIGSQTSQAVSLEVRQPQREPGEHPEAFIELQADQDSAYVQAQIRLTSRLFVRGDLVSGNLTDPSADAAVIERLGDQQESQELRGQHRYRVIERRYLLFPEQSGELQINAPAFTGELATGRRQPSLFGRGTPTRSVYAAGEPIRLQVKPQPAEFTGQAWLPAREVKLTGQLQPAGGPWRVGEPLTRTVVLEVDGQLHTQLPELQLPAPAGAQSYAEPAESRSAAAPGGIRATVDYRQALIPSTAGSLQLPAIRLPWWNTETDQMEVAVLPARSIPIAAAAGSPANPPPTAAPSAPRKDAPTTAAPSSAKLWWQILALSALAGWFGTLAAWFWQQRRTVATDDAAPPPVSPRRLLRELQSGPPGACRAALIDWAGQQFGQRLTLAELRAYCQDADAHQALADLDACLFGAGQTFDRKALLNWVRRFAEQQTRPPASALPPLHPA